MLGMFSKSLNNKFSMTSTYLLLGFVLIVILNCINCLPRREEDFNGNGQSQRVLSETVRAVAEVVEDAGGKCSIK